MSNYFSPHPDEALIENVLAMQANALNQGRDTTEWLIAQFSAEASPQTAEQLIALLYLAQQLKRTLVPLPAPARLTQPPSPRPTTAVPPPTRPSRPTKWIWAAVASLLAGLAGIFLWRHTRMV